jgi:hypothetical protein
MSDARANNVLLGGISALDHVPVTELERLSARGPHFASDDDLTSLGICVHDDSDSLGHAGFHARVIDVMDIFRFTLHS